MNSSVVWADVLVHLQRLPAEADVLSVVAKTELLLETATRDFSSDVCSPTALHELLEQQLPTVVEALYVVPLSVTVASTVSNCFARVLEFAAAALVAPALADGALLTDLNPLIYVVRLLLGTCSLERRFPVPPAPAFGPGCTPPAATASAAEGRANGDFYRDYGCPLQRACQGRVLHLWPDNLAGLRVSEPAEGWSASICDSFGDRLPGSTPGVTRHVHCEIIGAHSRGPLAGQHTVRLAPAAAGEACAEASVDLATFDVRWTERSSTAHAHQAPPGLAAAIEAEAADRGQPRLLYSALDVGAQLRVWKQQRREFVAAEVVAYDAVSGQHTVKCEDSSSSSSSNQHAASAVLKRYNLRQRQHTVVSHRGGYAMRPAAALCPNTSVYLLQNVDAFGCAGGFEALAQRLNLMACPSAKEVSAEPVVLLLIHTPLYSLCALLLVVLCCVYVTASTVYSSRSRQL
jgi:hypothetical protein